MARRLGAVIAGVRALEWLARGHARAMSSLLPRKLLAALVVAFCAVPASAATLGEAVDNPALVLTSSGDAPWFAQSAVSFSGGSAAQSGTIDRFSSTTLETTVTGPVTLSFRWRLSTEPFYGFLTFHLDDSPVAAIPELSGEIPWTQRTLMIPAGTHTLKWTYRKDNAASYDAFSDAAWIDQIVLTPGQAGTPSSVLSVSSANGLVTSLPGGINCDGDGTACSQAFIAGAQVTLTPAPAPGYVFSGWAGACSGTGACTVTMTGAQSVSAVFSLLPGTQAVTRLSGGADFTMVLKADGTLWGWGENWKGQLGNGTTQPASSPVPIGTAADWAAVAAGSSHTVALKTNGTLWAWGDNFYGQLGDLTLVDRSSPAQLGTATDWTAIAAGTGGAHSVALKSDGTLWTWGANWEGQLGRVPPGDRGAMAQVGTASDWRAIAAGGEHTVALKNDRTLWAWGGNITGQLGDGTTNNRFVPVKIGTDSDWAAIAAGGYHTVALKTNGTLWAWGHNSPYGQLGDGTVFSRNTPVQIGTVANWVSIDAGGAHTVALRSDGTLWAWGFGNMDAVPVQVSPATDWTTVSAGYTHSAALKADGTIWTWGLVEEDNSGEIASVSPVRVLFGGPAAVNTLAAGLDHNVAISGGQVWSWGGNAAGKLGNGITANSSIPVAAGGLANVVSVAAGMGHSLAARSDGSVWAWGLNARGQLGTTAQLGTCGFLSDPCALQPLQVAGISDAVQVAAGWGHSLARSADGAVWGWGYNQDGEVGDGSTDQADSPQRVRLTNSSSPLTASTIVAGYFHSLALFSGSVFAWGRNDRGQLGDDPASVDYRDRARAVPGLSNVIAIAAQGAYSLALKNDGTVWAWGHNAYGQLGNGTTLDSFEPVQVTGLTDVEAIAAGFSTSFARKRDGTIWSWGLNTSGQLGNGGASPHTCSGFACARTPVRATEFPDGSQIFAGGAHSVAIDAGGTISARGDNGSGQLGNRSGNFGSQYSPTKQDPLFHITPVPVPPSYTSIGESSGNGTRSLQRLAGVSFPPQPVGVASGARQLSFVNGGPAAITVSAVTVSGGEFSRSHTCGSVAPGANCAINVTFTPGGAGMRSALLTVTSSSSEGNTILLPLSGMGTGTGASTTALSSSASPSAFGAPLTLTATVTGAAPSGSVEFRDGASVLGSAPLVAGTARLTISSLALGIHTLTAVYGGDAGNASSTSATLPQTISAGHRLSVSAANGTLTSNPAGINCAGGAGSCAFNFVAGTQVVLTPAPAPGNAFDGWSGACTGSGACTVAMNADRFVTATFAGAGYALVLEAGFNLTGNAKDIVLDVPAIFGRQDSPVAGVTEKIISVWKWGAAAGKWAFHSPQLTASGNAAYAASLGYEVLSAINPGEGYWVNAVEAVVLPAQGGNPFGWSFLNFSALPSGFNLISSASEATPSQFNAQVSETPPAPGTIPTENFVSLWAWNAVFGKWYFYSPLLEASGGLPAVKAYADSHNYLHFQDPPEKRLGVGTGFWVNRP